MDEAEGRNTVMEEMSKLSIMTRIMSRIFSSRKYSATTSWCEQFLRVMVILVAHFCELVVVVLKSLKDV